MGSIESFEKSLGNDGEWPNLYYTGVLRLPPWRVREGELPRTNKRGLLGGVPPQVQEEEQTSVSLKAMGQASLWSRGRKPVSAFLCLVCVCSLVVSQESFLSKLQV